MRLVLLHEPRRSEDLRRGKTLTVGLDYITMLPVHGTQTCYVDYTVRTGDGLVLGGGSHREQLEFPEGL